MSYIQQYDTAKGTGAQHIFESYNQWSTYHADNSLNHRMWMNKVTMQHSKKN